MPAPNAKVEQRWLWRSIVVTAALGLTGIVWGIASGSQMILLDGVYGVIGIVVSWLLLRASALASAGPTREYPFGREGVTPLVIGIQGFVLLATLLYAAVEAVFVIVDDGGSEVTAGWAIAYGVLATTASIAVWMLLRRAAGTSDLLIAEATAWGVAMLRGVGMIVGFAIMGVLEGTSWDGAAPYVDPVMVLLTCALFVLAPIRMVRTTIVELLERVPDDDIRLPVLDAVTSVQTRFDLDPPDVRVTKLGPKLYVELEGVVDPHVTITQEHEVRLDLQRRLDALPYDVWLNVELTPRTDDGPE